jgi:hypothetical protein
MLFARTADMECWNCGDNEWDLCVCPDCNHPWNTPERMRFHDDYTVRMMTRQR